MVRKRRLDHIVSLPGPVTGEDKHVALRDADVYVQTSRNEGHSISVLEALAHGLPCLLTPATHMAREVAEAEAGWAVEPSPAGIARGLLGVMDSRLRLAYLGRNARALVQQRYTWDQAARRAVEAYRRVVGQL